NTPVHIPSGCFISSSSLPVSGCINPAYILAKRQDLSRVSSLSSFRCCRYCCCAGICFLQSVCIICMFILPDLWLPCFGAFLLSLCWLVPSSFWHGCIFSLSGLSISGGII